MTPKLGKQSGRGAKWTEIRPESNYVVYPQWRKGFLGTQWDLQKSRLQTPWKQAGKALAGVRVRSQVLVGSGWQASAPT